MDLIAATYENIWPFKDQLVSINFKKGKYLIKAPIGTGKSFLFFDAPLFGLYWSSRSVGRAVLNVRASQGFVKLLFEDKYGQKWFVKRNISRSASGWEKVASELFKLTKDDIETYLDDSLKNVVNWWVEIESLIQPYLVVEEFKSSRELQKALDLLMPPKEVFLSTSFLVQDSENIFEIQPSERIRVFKEMFGLLDIDMAKEVVADKRKEVRWQISALEDVTIVNEKLKRSLSSLYTLLKRLLETNGDSGSSDIKTFIEDYEILWDKINIESFNLHIRADDLKFWEDKVKLQIQQYHHLKTSFDEKQSQFLKIKKQLDEVVEKIGQLSLDKENIEKKLKQIDASNIDELDKKRQIIVDQIKDLDNQLNWTALGIKKGDYPKVFVFFKELEEEWKRLWQQLRNLKDKLENLEWQKLKVQSFLKDLEEWGEKYQQLLHKEIETQKRLINEQLGHIEIKLEALEKEKKRSLKLLEELQVKLKGIKKQTFWCKKINADCPLIVEIGEKVFGIQAQEDLVLQINTLKDELKEIDLQLKGLLKQREKLKSDLKNIEKTVDISSYIQKEKEQIMSNWDLADLEKQLQKLRIDLIQQEEILNAKREAFKKLWWVVFKKQIWPQWENLNSQLRDIDEQINILKSQQKEKESLMAKVQKINGEISQLEKHKSNLREQIEQLQSMISELDKQLNNIDFRSLDAKLQDINKVKTNIVQLEEIIKDFTWRQKELHKLKDKEKVLKDLTNILGKELMVVVLQNFLPVLEDQINSLLSEVVDFQLRFSMKETKSGEQQLDIKILDMHWEREVKSLSWWQKVVLRLAWILSVSRILNARFLFLDETINNLDIDSIGRVARMLKHFLEKSPIKKFYVVTHSVQIQSMDIWDWVVELKSD